jgi:hypothetical protein
LRRVLKVVSRGVAWMVSASTCALAVLAAPSVRADPMSTSPEQAYDTGELPNARAVGMGGALNALGVSTAALSLNPANMAMARVYHLEAIGAFSPESQRQSYGGAVVDSVLNAAQIAGGLAGTWSQMDPQGINRKWTDIRAGLALPLGTHLALGATGRYLHVDQSVAAGPFGASYASDGTRNGPIFNSFTFDLGATASIVEGLRIGIAGHNLTNPSTALAPTLLAGGVGYTTTVFSIEADGQVDFTTWGGTRGRGMAGAELFVADRYALRAGYRYDGGTQLSSLSLGLGYVDPKWSVEVGIRRDLIGDHGQTYGVLALRYFYDALGLGGGEDQGGSF